MREIENFHSRKQAQGIYLLVNSLDKINVIYERELKPNQEGCPEDYQISPDLASELRKAREELARKLDKIIKNS